MVVPSLSDLLDFEGIADTGLQREVVPQQRRFAVSFEQQQCPLATGKTERRNPEVREVFDVPRIGNQQPFDVVGNDAPESGTAREAAFFCEHVAPYSFEFSNDVIWIARSQFLGRAVDDEIQLFHDDGTNQGRGAIGFEHSGKCGFAAVNLQPDIVD